jgi:hypothetical protein
MDTEKPTTSDPILARDVDGNEITLTVVERCELVCVQTSDGQAYIMPVASALELAWQIVEQATCIRRRVGDDGPEETLP